MITTQDIRRLIAQRHDLGLTGTPIRAPEWALFFELQNGTGGGKGDAGERYVDAFALNTYPSKKFWRVAYEIKVSRADFLKELSQPEKRQWGFDISNEFWFACAPGVAKAEEIPEECGLLVAENGKLKRVKVAKQRKARDLTMAEVSAFARRSNQADKYWDAKWLYQGSELDEEALDRLVRAIYDLEAEKRHEERARKWYEANIASVVRAVNAIRDALEEAGIPPMPWMRDIEQLRSFSTHSFTPGEWQMIQWVKDNISPGPNGRDLAVALDAASDAQKVLDRERANLARSIDAIQQNLSEVAKALNQARGVSAPSQPDQLPQDISGISPLVTNILEL